MNYKSIVGFCVILAIVAVGCSNTTSSGDPDTAATPDPTIYALGGVQKSPIQFTNGLFSEKDGQ